jgi:lysophospholipase L1-like esterase
VQAREGSQFVAADRLNGHPAMFKLKQPLVDACVIFTVTAVALACLESGARLARWAYFTLPADRGNPIFAKQPWGKQYEKDEAGLRIRYIPYMGFTETPYASPTINVDALGRRRVPGSCERPGHVTLWMFGGSTMFGYGAPDDGTIPAYLAQMLNARGRCTRVINFGTGSWQSSQSVVQLTRALAQGGRPDAVVFYDGINDAMTILDGAPPGDIDPLAGARLKRALDAPPGMLEALARSSVLVRILRNHVWVRVRQAAHDPRERAASNIKALAPAAAAVYSENVRMVDALAAEYGFNAYFFLQPYPRLSGKALTATEQLTKREFSDEYAQENPLLNEIYSAFRASPRIARNPRFFDISGVLDSATAELFTDPEHLLPEGNRIVAERMSREIRFPSRAAR